MPEQDHFADARSGPCRESGFICRSLWGGLGLACLSGVCLILSFPQFTLSGLAWFALVPLLVALRGRDLKAAFTLSSLTSLISFSGIFYWIWTVGTFHVLDYLLLAVYFSLYGGVFGLGLNWFRERTGLPAIALAPPFWVSLEYARAHAWFLSAPWMLLGHSQYAHPILTQIVSVTGVYGLSFVIVCVNVAVADVIIGGIRFFRHRASAPGMFPPAVRASAIVAASLLLGTVVFGMRSMARTGSVEHLNIALLQGDVPQAQKWDRASIETIVNSYERMTRQAAAQSPVLIVWPETAVPADVSRDPALRERLERLALDTKAYLLIGAAPSAKFHKKPFRGKYFNSLFLFSPQGRLEEEHRKILPVPFGEYDPLHGIVRWPQALIAAMGSVVPGDRYTIFRLPDASFGAVICWESIFPDLFREFVRQGARFMVNATDESWFHVVGASSQFLAMTTFRAIENGVSIVRAANAGISAVIDPFGRITQQLASPTSLALPEEGIVVAQIALSNGATFYTSYGDVFAFVQIAFCGILVAFLLARACVLRWGRAGLGIKGIGN